MFSWFRRRVETTTCQPKKKDEVQTKEEPKKDEKLQTGEAGQELIKGFESLRLEAYKPHKDDVWTIGWGTTRGVKQGMVIDRETAQEWFDRDLRIFENAIHKHVKVPLNQNQFDALVSFVYNVGEANFAASTLLKRLNAGKYEEVPAQLMRWVYSGGKKFKGLERRRKAEGELFMK